MQTLIFVGTHNYPLPHLGDFAGVMARDFSEGMFPTAIELADYLSKLQPAYPGQTPVSSGDWLTVLLVSGSALPQRQAWDLIFVAPTEPDPKAYLAKRGCTGWFEVKGVWRGLRRNEDICTEMSAYVK